MHLVRLPEGIALGFCLLVTQLYAVPCLLRWFLIVCLSVPLHLAPFLELSSKYEFIIK